MIEYDRYDYTRAERCKYGVGGGAVGFLLLLLFYNNLLLCAVLAVPSGVMFLKYYRKRLIEKRRWELTVQFKDAMESLVAALAAGYSLENSIREAKKDLGLMYTEGDIILREFDYMTQRMELNIPVETLMRNLGTRSGSEDIITFGEILVTVKRTGGNLVRIMRQTAANITEKIEIRREIETVISGKKMEAGCMTAVPLLMIGYLRVFSPGFLDPLYNNAMGAGIMTVALAVYLISFLWGQKIMKIDF